MTIHGYTRYLTNVQNMSFKSFSNQTGREKKEIKLYFEMSIPKTIITHVRIKNVLKINIYFSNLRNLKTTITVEIRRVT